LAPFPTLGFAGQETVSLSAKEQAEQIQKVSAQLEVSKPAMRAVNGP
jgi:hypothetical protein